MAKLSSLWLVLLLWPLAAAADEVDVPELGVKLITLPSAASKPQVAPQGAGLIATTQLGPAVLTIYRDNASAPGGADVADPRYRAALDARFDRSFDSKKQGAPTDIDGHSGWTVVSVQPASAGGATQYACLTYVVAAQHLYRLLVSAASSEGRPAQFDALVTALSGIKFEPASALGAAAVH
jgi:hypothetical protein